MTSVLPDSKSELRQNLHLACEALLDKKAEDLQLLYFGDNSPLTDCFLIATGTSVAIRKQSVRGELSPK